MLTKTLSEYFAEAKKIIKEARERGKPEFPTGLSWLDTMTGGMKRGEIWIVSGKTGAGKTSLALQMARSFADNPEHTILFLSLEMRGFELCLRMFCEMNGFNYFDLLNGHIELPEAVDKTFQDYIQNIDFEVVEAGYNFEEVEKILKLYYETKNPDIVFLDFIQLVEWRKYGDERVALMEYIRKIKELANKTNMGFVIVSQIRRLPSGADYNRPPDLYDLKGSGSLEQTANKVILIHKKTTVEKVGEANVEYYLNLAKNREGRIGQARVVFEGEFYRFKDFEFSDQAQKAKEVFEGEYV